MAIPKRIIFSMASPAPAENDRHSLLLQLIENIISRRNIMVKYVNTTATSVGARMAQMATIIV